MSLWLSVANSAANTLRAHAMVEAERQFGKAMIQATNAWLSLWSGAAEPFPVPRRTRGRR